MTDTITLIGIVATPPRHLITNAGLAITSFRLASTQRRFDRSQEKWVDADTNWYTVTTFRQLALNAAVSVVKGDRVIVEGRIRIRDWQAGERTGTNIDIEADALGHDLSWGTARWIRSLPTGQLGDQAAGLPASWSTPSSDNPDVSSVVTAADSWSTVLVGQLPTPLVSNDPVADHPAAADPDTEHPVADHSATDAARNKAETAQTPGSPQMVRKVRSASVLRNDEEIAVPF